MLNIPDEVLKQMDWWSNRGNTHMRYICLNEMIPWWVLNIFIFYWFAQGKPFIIKQAKAYVKGRHMGHHLSLSVESFGPAYLALDTHRYLTLQTHYVSVPYYQTTWLFILAGTISVQRTVAFFARTSSKS